MLHKVFISPNNFESVIRACYNEEYNNEFYLSYDSRVNNVLKYNEGGTSFKIENKEGVIVGFFVMKAGVINDTYIRKIFRISSYLSAINQLINEETVLKTNASLSFSRNKILN